MWASGKGVIGGKTLLDQTAVVYIVAVFEDVLPGPCV
jgi:hypothetical protein